MIQRHLDPERAMRVFVMKLITLAERLITLFNYLGEICFIHGTLEKLNNK